MKVLLVGNLPEDRQESMRRFTALVRDGMTARGHEVTEIAPRLRAGRLLGPYRYAGLPKYLGYFDKFVLFPRELRRHVAATRPDVVHITDHANAVYLPALRGTPTLVTCHDLLQVRAARGEVPQQRVGGFGRRYQEWIRKNLSQAPRIACVSAKTKADVHRLTALADERVAVVPNALNHPYRPLSPEIARERLGALAAAQGVDPGRLGFGHSGFVLHVGAAHWYKNRPGVLAIYAELRRRLSPPPALVMVGNPLSTEEVAQAKALGVSEHLTLFAHVSSEHLEAFYGLAEGLIFPSWDEGFGWPIAEAQACGCPVFTSHRPPMTEVGGDSAVYFDPADPAGAAQAITAAWPGRAVQRARGFAQARRWEPDAMFVAYETLYRELAAAGASPAGSHRA